LAELIKIVPFAPSTVWRKVKEGHFPKPVKLSDQITVWRKEDIRLWIEKQDS